MTIAYFVSPHGFGHAARAAAVMAAMSEINPTIRFEIFTQVPGWFFESSLSNAFGYHPVLTDVGLVQKTSLWEDLPETVRRLDDFLPFDSVQIKRLAAQVNKLECQAILCDIAPIGIAIAHEAGLPAILVENFTWDWIYEGYLPEEPRLDQHINYLRQVFQAADYHVQTEPVCAHRQPDLTTLPVSRKIKSPASLIRQKLGIPDQAKAVLLTMGGVPWHYTFLEKLAGQRGVEFVIPGATEKLERRGNLVLLPYQSDIFHPDLVNACDAVIGKIGYSTVAEVYQAGVPFGYVVRPRFREATVLVDYIKRKLNGLAIDETQFQDGAWLAVLPELLALPRLDCHDPDGAGQIANFVRDKLQGT